MGKNNYERLVERYTNRLNQDIKKFHYLNPVWDNEQETALNIFEIIDLLNKQNKEIIQLKKENESLRRKCKLSTENDELKNQIKYCLDVIFSMKNYAESDDYMSIIKVANAVQRRFINE